MFGWLAHLFAFDSTTDEYYAAESGSLTIIVPPVLSVGAIYVLYRVHHACQVKRCYRLARHEADGHSICHHHAGRHKALTTEHLKHYQRTGVMPKPALPASGHANQEEIQ